MKYLLITFLFVFAAQAQHYSSTNNDGLKLSPELAGNILLGEMNCVSCHESDSKDILRKQAPSFKGIANRIKRDYIISYLQNPQKVKPGTSMPDILHSLSEKEKLEAATALAEFLPTLNEVQRYSINDGKNPAAIKRGKELFHTIGCVACHSPRDEELNEISKSSVPLGDLTKKYHVSGLAEFLFQPHKVRSSGRMPDMKLSKKEAEDLASYLTSGQKTLAPVEPSNPKLIEKGRKLFVKFNCSSCHQHERFEPSKSLNLSSIKSADCKGPKYSFSDKQKKNIEAALSSNKALNKTELIQQTFTAFNCYSCHERDGIGGPGDKSEFFTTSEGELGNAGRFPPTLTDVGAKLQRSWMRKVLFKGESVRDYMHTRMPQFGEKNIGHIVDILDAHDKVPATGMKEVTTREEKKTHREAGWKLVGVEGNNCIACHNYNNHPSLGLKAFDIVSTAKRLKPDWFYHYMINPTKHRPGIIMPSFWPNGQAVQKNILGGDTTEQLRAMWYYFTIGQTQRLPKGLKVPPTELAAKAKVNIYRGRSRVAGFRGIAIGFPEQFNLAYNAEFMNFTSIWRGDFVRVNWRGQAAGDFNPAERDIPFNHGVPFARVQLGDPWPEMVKIEGKNRLNPDPLFVRNQGYQFKGYYLNEKGLPVLMYKFGEISIEEELRVEAKSVVRAIKFNSPKEDQFLLRLAVSDKIVDKGEGVFAVQDQLEIISSSAVIQKNDLIQKVSLPSGKSEMIITYRFSK